MTVAEINETIKSCVKSDVKSFTVKPRPPQTFGKSILTKWYDEPAFMQAGDAATYTTAPDPTYYIGMDTAMKSINIPVEPPKAFHCTRDAATDAYKVWVDDGPVVMISRMEMMHSNMSATQIYTSMTGIHVDTPNPQADVANAMKYVMSYNYHPAPSYTAPLYTAPAPAPLTLDDWRAVRERIAYGIERGILGNWRMHAFAPDGSGCLAVHVIARRNGYGDDRESWKRNVTPLDTAHMNYTYMTIVSELKNNGANDWRDGTAMLCAADRIIAKMEEHVVPAEAANA